MKAPALPPPGGVLVIDKPRGPTSHDVVSMVRRALGTREVGHAGTLDPMATGVLVLAIGEATKLVLYLTAATKRYEARISLGRETDTLDAMGEVTLESAVDPELLGILGGAEDRDGRLAAAVAAELARTSQAPPIYSAIQQDGERAYALARRGETVVLDERPVRVHALTVSGMATAPEPWLDVQVTADKGYYVRSLGRDLARGLGTVGHLTALRRTQSGDFSSNDAIALTATREELRAHLVPLVTAARRALPSAALTDDGVRDARHGKRVRREDFVDAAAVPLDTSCAWFDGAGALVAIGVVGEEGGRVARGFVPPRPGEESVTK